jgi:hypothetical protein
VGSVYSPEFTPKADFNSGGGEMKTLNFNVSEDHGNRFAQVYLENHSRLKRYFLSQLGDGPEVDDCIEETMRHFSFFMEDHDWEVGTEYIPIHLMVIAGGVCTRTLGEKRTSSSAVFGNESHSLFNKVRAEATRAIKERIELMKLFLRLPEQGGGHPSNV